jgi:hypothetical protein
LNHVQTDAFNLQNQTINISEITPLTGHAAEMHDPERTSSQLLRGITVFGPAR